MTAMRSRYLLLSLIAMAMTAGPLDAQRAPGPRSGEDRMRLEERIRARMGEIIRNRLGLDREEEARLSEIVQEYERRRHALVTSERETRQQIRPLLESEPTDTDAAALMDRMIALKRQEAELFQEEQERLQELLTPTQVLQLYELRVEIGRRIRALRSGNDEGAESRRRDRSRRPGGGYESPVER